MVNVLNLEWHVYGLLLGLSVWLAWELVAYQARRQRLSLKVLEKVLPWVIAGGVVGARLYHVVTDWSLYVERPLAAVFFWQGGLSVIGAVLGGGVVLYLALARLKKTSDLPLYLDLSVFGLPFAQALGRWGNYFNQELYGRPASLPWAVTIDPPHRLPGYQDAATYHPLFAYEMVAMLVFGLGVWWWARRSTKLKLGSGQLFAVYLGYYAVVRFFLDFLRIDTRYLLGTPLTVNQAVMLVLLVVVSLFLAKKTFHAKT